MPLSWLARGAASAERGRRLMELRGVTPNGHPLWQGWEVRPVVELDEYRLIFPLLDRRTRPAVYSKAGRLGATKRKRRLPWSDNEIIRLRKVYPKATPQELASAFPGRSRGAIIKAANSRGIFRVRRQEEPTGSTLLDQILARAKKMGLSRQDLDAMIRRKGYFARRKWRRTLDHAAHHRAVFALGGQLRAGFANGLS